MSDQVQQLHALKSLVTEEHLTETGRHFVDGNYASLTECHHGDTGEFRNKADGEAIALLWNLWKDGKLGVRRDDDTPPPASVRDMWRDKWHPQYKSLAHAISAAAQDLIVSADLVRNKTVGKRLQEHAHLLGYIAYDLAKTPSPVDRSGGDDAHWQGLLAAQDNVIDGLMAENDKLRKALGDCLDLLELKFPNPAPNGQIARGRAALGAPISRLTIGDNHPDAQAVDRFAAAMKAKLAWKRAEGRSGWDDPEQCHIDYLHQLLHEQFHERTVIDPVDIANLAMMIHERSPCDE